MNPDNKTLFTEFYNKYYADIYSYVRSHVNNEMIAKDITADTFVIALTKFDTVKEHPNQIGWLYKAARFKLKEFYKKLQNDLHPVTEEMIAGAPFIESGYSARELELSLSGGLSPAEYERFQRYFIWGYSLTELAQLEAVTTGTMATRLSRLRTKIKKLLDREE